MELYNTDKDAAISEFPSVILIDDIMYLKSMRREIYVIARDKGIPVFTVWVKVDFEIAKQRNLCRPMECRVSDAAMNRIFIGFEPPVSSLIFDRCNYTVNGSCEARYEV